MSEHREVREMRTAETVLNIIRERGQRGLPLERLYRQLYNRDLYLRAYGKALSQQRRNDTRCNAGNCGWNVTGRKSIPSLKPCARNGIDGRQCDDTYIPKKQRKTDRSVCLPGRTSCFKKSSACFWKRTMSHSSAAYSGENDHLIRLMAITQTG